MAYQDRERPDSAARAFEGQPGRYESALAWVSRLTNGLARAAGLALLLVGLWAGVKVVFEAWGLYRDPSAVERLARIVDRASHVDSLVAPRPAAPTGSEGGARPAPPSPQDSAFRPSYFIAWVIAILLLLLVGKLASWIARAGGAVAIVAGRSPPDR
jgi:disulfide bond formation protein DsbB